MSIISGFKQLAKENAAIRKIYLDSGMDPEPIMKERVGTMAEFMKLVPNLLPIKKLEKIDFNFGILGNKIPGRIYKPAGEGKWPLVAFDMGLKTGVIGDWEVNAISELLARMGNVVFGVLSNLEVSHVEVHDYKNAMRYIKNNYNFTTNDWAFIGGSSGGAVAAMFAAEKSTRRFGRGKTVIVDTYSDLIEAYYHIKDYVVGKDPEDHRVKVCNKYLKYSEEKFKFPEQNPKDYKEASPKTYVRDINVPVLLLHGFKDEIVPVEMGMELCESMKVAGKDVTFRIYPGQVIHGPIVAMDKTADVIKYATDNVGEVYGLMLTMGMISKYLKSQKI